MVVIVLLGIVASIMLVIKNLKGWYVAILMFVVDIIYNVVTLYDNFKLNSLDVVTIISRASLILCAVYFIFIILSEIRNKNKNIHTRA